MKKMYGYMLALSLIIPGFMQAMQPEKPKSYVQQWWDRHKKKVYYSAGTIIATALAIFGTYAAIRYQAKAHIKSLVIAGTFSPKGPSEKASLESYYSAQRPHAKNRALNHLVQKRLTKMTFADIAQTAIDSLTRKK